MIIVNHQPQIAVSLSSGRILISKTGFDSGALFCSNEVVLIPIEYASAVIDGMRAILAQRRGSE